MDRVEARRSGKRPNVLAASQRDNKWGSSPAPDSEPVIKERSADMHAIIETGGKQYKVAEGDTL